MATKFGSGSEIEVMLDHEAICWGRYLKTGGEVTLHTDDPIKAIVKHVWPWRERTQAQLVIDTCLDQADLLLGQRVAVGVSEPPAEIQTSKLPTDISRN